MFLAIICYHLGIFNQDANKIFTDLLMLVVNPLLALTVFQTDYSPKLLKGLILAFFLAFLIHAAGIFLTLILRPFLKTSQAGLESFACIYTNCGFIGIPLVQSILGNHGVFYLTAYITVSNLIVWTHGLVSITGEFSLSQIKKTFFSPIIIATLAGVLLFILQIRLPDILLDTFRYISCMNTALAMIIAGLSIAQINFKTLFFNSRIYLICALRLLVFPFLFITLLYPFRHMDSTVLYTILIAGSCPIATTITIISIQYQKNYKYAAELFAFSTLLSLFTLPLVIRLAEAFLSLQ